MKSNDKVILRNHFRSLRQQINPALKEIFAQQATQHFITQDVFRVSQNIACYLSVKSEMNMSALIEMIWQNKKNCFLPVITNQGKMLFHKYSKNDQLISNQFNILEPLPSAFEIALEELDIVFMPLIAYDQQGHRLGSGGGYYDKTFSHYKPNQRNPLRIGWAYSIQQTDQLPHEEWDIDLHAIVTEKEYTLFSF
jgi:5-formyltetrahydrofolate cyclo-ligase